MTNDTRKDRRVKIVSLNVRYKSATVDEFIENHSHDVSKGGIYIKTSNPFPPGTLLKFEIRLAGDQSVIAGVGRVVWKREPTSSNPDRPAGMGVKFIKVDEPSRSLIDRLTSERADAGRAYESESPQEGLVNLASVPPPSKEPPRPRQSTMSGLGSSSSSTANPMFPSTPLSESPKREATVMKQAAELLEEALKEAGGSVDDISRNPLFSATRPEEEPQTTVMEPAPPFKEDPQPAKEPPQVGGTHISARLPQSGQTERISAVPPVAAQPMQRGDSGGFLGRGGVPIGSRDGTTVPPKGGPPKAKVALPAVASSRPRARNGFPWVTAGFLLLAAGGLAAFAFRDKLFRATLSSQYSAAAPPTPTAPPPPDTATSPTASSDPLANVAPSSDAGVERDAEASDAGTADAMTTESRADASMLTIDAAAPKGSPAIAAPAAASAAHPPAKPKPRAAPKSTESGDDNPY